MSLSLVSAPVVGPVIYEDVKDHLNIEHDDDIEKIERFIKAATNWAESFLHIKLVPQTWDYKFNKFPSSNAFCLPLNPVVSVESITYTDANSSPNEQTLSTDVYALDNGQTPAEVYLKYGKTWPNNRNHRNDITVRFITGFVDSGASPRNYADGIPEDIKAGVLCVVDDLFRHRGLSTDMKLYKNSTAENLLSPHRIMSL